MISLSLLLLAQAVHAPDTAQPARQAEKVPLTRLAHRAGHNALGSIAWNHGLNYVLAGAATYAIAETGLDEEFYRFSTDNAWIGQTGFVSVIGGGLIPMFGPLSLYVYGRRTGSPDLQITALALGQSALLALSITSSLKVFTGRAPPDEVESVEDHAYGFRFGFWRGGAFDGWPSSHTAVAFAMAASLTELYPDRTGLAAGVLAYATLIGLGVSTNIHWFSDAVAGALVGYAIGKVVGRSFQEMKLGRRVHLDLQPRPAGASLAFTF